MALSRMLGHDMQLSIISYIRNEADIVETFVRYHAHIAQKIIIVLRPSEDGTDAILASLQQEGLPLIIIHDPSPAFRQAAALRKAFAIATNDIPDWILPLDADEFLIGTIAVSDVFAQLPSDVITLLPWKTYVPTTEDDATEPNVLRRITHRRTNEVRPFFKSVIPAALFDRAQVQTGNHTVLDQSTRHPLSAVSCNVLSLAHFPVRSIAQITRKIATGWTGLEPHATHNQGYHWRDLHARFAEHPPTEEDLTTIALRYALQDHDPMPRLIPDPIV